MQTFDQRLAIFLAHQKEAEQRTTWRRKLHPDYVEARSRLIVIGVPNLYGTLILTAHLARVPYKYGFSVEFSSERVLGLDVEPGRSHTDPETLESVNGTHWHKWKGILREDARNLHFSQWLDQFIKEAKIRFRYPCSPPRLDGGVQMDMQK